MSDLASHSPGPPPVSPALWLLDDGLILGGGQLFALRLARTADLPVHLVCPRGSALWARAEADGVSCIDVTFPAPSPAQAPALVAAARRLRHALAGVRRGDGIVVSGGVRCSLVAGAALAGRADAPPLVHLLHERDSAARLPVRLALRRSRRLLAVGAGTAAVYRAALPGARVTQTNNFLAPDALAALMAARPAEDVRGPAAPPRVGVLARVIPEKGIAELVGEAGAVPDAWASLSVAGPLQDGAEVARVRSAISAAGLDGRVELVGPVDDVGAFVAGIDVLVVPSVGNEAQPTVILEALAAGVPVVARAPIVSTDFAGLPVVAYATAAELGAALRALPAACAEADVLADRFGPAQVLDAIAQAAA